jgi:choline dehydrogenase
MTDAACYDYLVVGAGSAGCIVAARLSEDPAVTVWLGEAGGADRDPLLGVPGLLFRTSTSPRFNWSYRTEPEAELGGRQLFWAQGRVLGGSSTINGMIYIRGHAREYDLWRQDGCDGWGWEDVLPHFRATECNERGAGDYHGGDGPLPVTRGTPDVPICGMFLDAMRRGGHAILDDFNGPSMDGFGHYDRTIGGGRRRSVATAYLRPARARPNLTVATDATVARIIIEHGRARGIELRQGGAVRRITAAREVILCAGAVNSPKLLMLSGIGPAAQLRALGIDVLHDAPGVGGNLQNHLCYRMLYACNAPVTAYRYMHPLRGAAACLDYVVRRRGILSQTTVATGGFLRTEPGLEMPDAQVQIGIGLIGNVGASAWQRLPRREGFTVVVNQGRPHSRGTVRLRSADPADPPVIAPRYLSDRRDLDVLMRATRQMRALMRDAELRRVISEEIAPGEAAEDDAVLEADIRARASNAFHPAGTCRMGGDAEAVVDPRLRLRGIAGLRVADASIMPSLINGNTNAASMMIGEKAAAMLRADATGGSA